MVSHKKKVATRDLRLGMYVIELDRPWTETNFPFQGFSITSQEQIAELQSYCESVYIDPERDQGTPEKRGTVHVLARSAIYRDSVPVEEEFPVAKEIYKSCEDALHHLIATARSEGEIDAQALTSAMGSMIGTIQRNPDAMLLLHAVRRKNTQELARALDNSILMVTFGNYLRYPTSRLEVLGLAGMLLDVGMTLLPDDVVNAFNAGDVVDEKLVETHVLHSVELIRKAQGLPAGVDEAVVLHHERQDGEGYPYRRSRDQISADGAIAAIVDSYSKLTSPQPNAAPLTPSSALSQLHRGRGRAFQEALLEQFIQCIGIYPVGSAVELNTGEAGIVIAQNAARRLLPRVIVMLDSGGMRIEPQLVLDLMKEPKTPTGEPYRIRRALTLDQLPLNDDDFLLYP